MNICDVLNILNWKWWKSNAPFDFKINSMVKTIKNITNMFCDAIFSHLRYVSEAKQFTKANNTWIYKGKLIYNIKILSIKQYF